MPLDLFICCSLERAWCDQRPWQPKVISGLFEILHKNSGNTWHLKCCRCDLNIGLRLTWQSPVQHNWICSSRNGSKALKRFIVWALVRTGRTPNCPWLVPKTPCWQVLPAFLGPFHLFCRSLFFYEELSMYKSKVEVGQGDGTWTPVCFLYLLLRWACLDFRPCSFAYSGWISSFFGWLSLDIRS